MKYCILGDIHGNLEALETVIEHAENNGAERYVSVGDVVGYGANPKECVEKLRELECPTVAGSAAIN